MVTYQIGIYGSFGYINVTRKYMCVCITKSSQDIPGYTKDNYILTVTVTYNLIY